MSATRDKRYYENNKKRIVAKRKINEFRRRFEEIKKDEEGDIPWALFWGILMKLWWVALKNEEIIPRNDTYSFHLF